MSLQVIITGTLTRQPQTKVSANDHPYTTTLVRVPTDQGTVSASVIAFGEVGEVLATLDKGDEVALSGSAVINEWEREGELFHGLHVLVEQVMTPYKLRKKQAKVQAAQNPEPKKEDDFLDSVDDFE